MVALLFDMDGVIYRGEQPIPDAIEFVRSVQHLPHVFVTNNSAKSPTAVVKKLAGLGISTTVDRVLTSAQTTAAHLANLKPGFRFFAVGGPGVSEALVEAGGTADHEAADFVVIGEGPGLDYASLTTGINLLISGNATLFGTNPDVSVDAGDGKVVPGAGALLAPFQVAAGIPSVPCIGKPHPTMFLTACQRLGVHPTDCIMVGDRPDTDIKGAAALNMRTVLVLTGRYQEGTPYPADVPQPSRLVKSLSEISLDWILAEPEG